jgi:hypothetical protein
MDKQYKSLENLCKTNDIEVIRLLDSGIIPSLQCLLYACKVDSNSTNIIKLIEKGILPNKRCLLCCCNRKNNANGIIKIIRSGVKPSYDCLNCSKIYTNDNYDAFVEICSYLSLSYIELKYACAIFESNKSVYYMIHVLGVKPDGKCIKTLCKYNNEDYKTLKVLLDSNVKIKYSHIQIICQSYRKKYCMDTIYLSIYYYIKQHSRVLKQKKNKIELKVEDIYSFIKLLYDNNIELDKLIV